MSASEQVRHQTFNQLLLRVFPSLTKINGDYLYDVVRQPQKRTARIPVKFHSQEFQNLQQILRTTQTFRAFVTRQLSSRILVTFFSQTPTMLLLQSQLPFILLQRLSLYKVDQFTMLNDLLWYKNHKEVQSMKNAVRIITAHIVKKQVRYGALIKRMSGRQE